MFSKERGALTAEATLVSGAAAGPAFPCSIPVANPSPTPTPQGQLLRTWQ